jgi:putative PEP-CTERM system TPR-repeat lipoprotein
MNTKRIPNLPISMAAKPSFFLHWLIVALCLTGTIVALAADSDEYLRDAQIYFDKGEVSAAIIQLKNALLVNPDNSQARLLLGNAYLNQKNGPSAVKELRRAQELGVAREVVLVPLGRALLMTGQSDKLIQTITREEGDSEALQLDILLLQGQAYLATGKLAMAEEKFSAALDQQPGAAEALLGQAHIAYQNQDTNRAAALVSQALSSEPKNTDAWTLKGELQRQAGQSQEAATSFGKALELDPGNVQARLGRATVRLVLGEPDQANADIEWLLKTHPGLYLAQYLKALLQYQQQRLEPAQESVQRAIKQAPGHLPSHLLAGTIAYQQDLLNQAEQHLRTYWSADPGNSQAAKLLAATYLKLKQPVNAIEVLEPGLPSVSGDAQYLSLLGSAYLSQGNTAKGLEYLEQAASLAPDVAGIRTQLAIAQLAQGDVAEGISELQSAVDLGQGLVQADLLLVMAHLQRKEFDQALGAIDALAGKMPESPVPLNLKGAALLGMEDRAAAKQAFEAALTLQSDFLPAQLNLAQLELLDGNTEAAEARYKAVLSHDEGNVKALIALATLAHQRGDGNASKQWLEQARSHHPQAIEPALLLLGYYLRENNQEHSLDIAGELVVAHPRHPQVLRSVAQAHIQAGDYGAAARAIRTLVEVSPASAEAHYLQGVVQLKQKQVGDARVSLSRAIELQPNYPVAQLVLARINISEKDYDAALKIAAVLEQAHPDASFADELRGDLAAAKNAPKEAAEAYTLAYRMTASAQLARKLYQSQIQAGDFESALAALKGWLEAHPEDIPIRSLLANALIRAERNPQAINEYLAVIEHDPANVAALNNIAWLYQEQGNYQEGVKYAERAHKLVPERPEVMDTLGWLLVLEGETNRGLLLLQEARAKAPHIPDIHYHMAVALEKAGRREEARKELDRLLKSNKAFTEREKAEALRNKLGG